MFLILLILAANKLFAASCPISIKDYFHEIQINHGQTKLLINAETSCSYAPQTAQNLKWVKIFFQSSQTQFTAQFEEATITDQYLFFVAPVLQKKHPKLKFQQFVWVDLKEGVLKGPGGLYLAF